MSHPPDLARSKVRETSRDQENILLTDEELIRDEEAARKFEYKRLLSKEHVIDSKSKEAVTQDKLQRQDYSNLSSYSDYDNYQDNDSGIKTGKNLMNVKYSDSSNCSSPDKRILSTLTAPNLQRDNKQDNADDVEHTQSNMHRHSTLSAMIGQDVKMMKQINPVCSRSKKIKFQQIAYNFLEKPTGMKCFIYHVFVFMLVVVCLILSVLSTIEGQFETNQLVFIMEAILVTVFSVEYAVRLWSAGCVSKYKGIRGRLQFARKPICIIDLVVVAASVVILLFGRKGNVFAASAIRGIRFLQILRMLHVDRQGGTWRLLGSVVYIHRQELITTLYIGFLALIFSSYFVYLAEHESEDGTDHENSQEGKFRSYADALWWGVVTVTTIGYGDHVPITWMGKVIASCFSIFAISFFALPAGILGSGFALKVQQKQRKKQFNRQIPAAAKIIQACWRVYATSETTNCVGTWRLYKLSTRRNEASIADSLSIQDDVFHCETKPQSTASSPNDKLHQRKQIRWSDNDAGSTFRIGSCTSKTEPKCGRSHRLFSWPFDNSKQTNPQKGMPESYKNVVRAIRKLIYFLSKKRFQIARKPYDVRDVVEQYSQGHANVMMRIKELQRRLDQTVGKPSSFCESDNQSFAQTCDRQHYTAGGRLVKLEKWMDETDRKLKEIHLILQRMEERSQKNDK